MTKQETTFRRLSIIVPVFNEATSIREVIKTIQGLNALSLEKEIVVVDDGSSDGTREIIQQIPGIRRVFHEKNRGKGAAVKTGIKHSLGDIVLIQDADLEYNPNDYPMLLKPILAHEVEFVMGSRFLYKRPKYFTQDGSPFFSHFIGNMAINFLTNVLYGQRNTDYEGCYKVFTKNLALSIPVAADGFAYDNELTCKALRCGYKIREVPIQYTSRSYSDGKKICWRDGLVMLWTIIRCRVCPMPKTDTKCVQASDE